MIDNTNENTSRPAGESGKTEMKPHTEIINGAQKLSNNGIRRRVFFDTLGAQRLALEVCYDN